MYILVIFIEVEELFGLSIALATDTVVVWRRAIRFAIDLNSVPTIIKVAKVRTLVEIEF
jgi:hypothetical protein